jgi:Caspase domain
MRTGFLFFATLISLFLSNVVLSQTGESKFKMVVINPNEKKIRPLFPAFNINDLSFTEENKNGQLDGKENGSLRFYIKNTGTILLQQLNVDLNTPDSAKGITYGKTLTVKQINPGDSTLVNFPFFGDETLKDGKVQFEIHIKDVYSDSLKMAQLIIPTREALKPPFFNWVNPVSSHDNVDFSVFEIAGLVKTKQNITGLKVYINGQIPDDKKSFGVLATENPNEYRIERTLSLNEGENEIKIEVRNSQGVTTSESRVINYFIRKIDQTYIESRLALVIGNADYYNSTALRNPINDAEAIASALKDLGFTVLKYLNADLKTMKKAIDEFGVELPKYNVGLFYYAGHGMQVKGNNYLIPVDASLKVEQDVDYDCVDAGRLLGKMEAAGSSTNIVILDVCRDNPFSRSWSSRSLVQGEAGLASMNAPSGSIVAYATSPGKTASDGTGKNGIYTEAILQYIKVPSLSIENFLKNVRVEVEKKSNRTQTPWESTSLKGNFYFKIK